jgi:universal stress protein E
LLKFFGAELHIAHVVPSDYPISSLAGLPMVVPEIEIGRRVRRHLKDAAKKYSVGLRRENIHALRGRPFEEICRLAANIDIDLIITSTRGNTGLKHLMLGSTAERIVQHSPCPVLVVPKQDRNPSNGKFARRRMSFAKILVPIDFSACSLKGLEYAKALAAQFGSKLVLLHSVHLQYYVASDEYARYDFPLLMQQAEKAAQGQMRDLVRKTDLEGVKVETLLEIGHSGQQICARAEDFGADLIVTSTHGTTGLKHMLIGSTAEYVVRHTHCPVLVVPTRERPALPSTKTRI